MQTSCPICKNREICKKYKRESYTYYQCTNCKHLFLNPLPSKRDIDRLYSSSYLFRVDQTALDRFTSQSQRICRKIKKLLPNFKTLLDVGTGYGTFVKIARQNHLAAIGIEPAKNLYNQARKSNRHIYHSTLEEYVRKNRNTFDALTLIHVIEHVRSPLNTLRELKKVINNPGVIFIETPSSDSWLRIIERDRFTFLTPPDHIHLFSPQSLIILLKKLFPKSKIQIQTYSYPEHFIGILRILKRRLFGQTIKLPINTPKLITRNASGNHTSSHQSRDNVLGSLTKLLNLNKKGSIMQCYVQIA